MEIFSRIELAGFVGTLFYAVVGAGLLGLCYLFIELVTPFSIRKEIEEEHNTALAIMLGALFVALAIIIAAVIVS